MASPFCQMIFDDAGKPIDFVYLQVNDAFEKITGKKRMDHWKEISEEYLKLKKLIPNYLKFTEE